LSNDPLFFFGSPSSFRNRPLQPGRFDFQIGFFFFVQRPRGRARVVGVCALSPPHPQALHIRSIPHSNRPGSEFLGVYAVSPSLGTSVPGDFLCSWFPDTLPLPLPAFKIWPLFLKPIPLRFLGYLKPSPSHFSFPDRFLESRHLHFLCFPYSLRPHLSRSFPKICPSPQSFH